jgi:hypothetical protein
VLLLQQQRQLEMLLLVQPILAAMLGQWLGQGSTED